MTQLVITIIASSSVAIVTSLGVHIFLKAISDRKNITEMENFVRVASTLDLNLKTGIAELQELKQVTRFPKKTPLSQKMPVLPFFEKPDVFSGATYQCASCQEYSLGTPCAVDSAGNKFCSFDCTTLYHKTHDV